MLKQLSAESGYTEMDAFAPGVIDEMLDQASIDDDIALADLDPWDYPPDEDDPE
jgi:hypothetical protein